MSRLINFMFERPEEASVVLAKYVLGFAILSFLAGSVSFILGYFGYWT